MYIYIAHHYTTSNALIILQVNTQMDCKEKLTDLSNN